MPLPSLPSPYGIGSIGRDAREFIDFLASSGQKYWQLLPLGPTGYGDSPYSSFSTFAGNPYLVDLETLVEEGLLSKNELDEIDWGSDEENIDYGKIYLNREKVLKKAFSRISAALCEEIDLFAQSNSWLENYAVFMALKHKFNMICWTEWPDYKLAMHDADAVESAGEELNAEISFHKFVQFEFFKQWADLRSYAKSKGIAFIGDVPIYAALDSADVWSEPELFQLDEHHHPSRVAGCPPDAFTDDGQLWGNPLYDWQKMKKSGYDWWIRRMAGASKLYDIVRIDHFRGFDSYWSIPAGDTTARNGKWVRGPGMSLVKVLRSRFPEFGFIAEDLGYLTDRVKKLVDDSGFPGMKVLEFAFDAHGDSIYLPHRFGENCVCYIGTHDNDTVLGWVQTLSEEEKNFAAEYMNIKDSEPWNWALIRTGMQSKANLFVAQMQDVLGLGSESRINTPGTLNGNWRWRMKRGELNDSLAEKLYEYTKKGNRC